MSPEIGEDQRTEDIIIEEIDNDEGDLIVQDPVPMDAMPDIFADADADVVELPARNHTGEAGEPIDVDGPSQSEMQAEFKQLSLSNTQKYDYKDDPSIDEATRQAMEEVLNGRPKRYTRRDTTVLRDSPIMLDDENDTITDTLRGLRRKLDWTSMTSPTTPPSRRVSGKVIPTNAPVIIVFDSLGLKHVPTIKALRDYIIEEAKSKHGMDVAREDIHGMHAKVPKQSNYCDCGVFLLHYVEKFLLDPDRYLPDMLARVYDSIAPELTQELWGSGEVSQKRQHILELIQTLAYETDRQQRQQAKAQQDLAKEEPPEEQSVDKITSRTSPPPKRQKADNRRKSIDSRIDKVIELD